MEFKKDDSFFTGRLKSVGYAIRGAVKLLTTEHSVMVQSFVGVAMIFAGFWFEISAVEWMLQILAMGLVLSVEGLNTAIEKIADFIHPDYHEKIGFIKDISAGAVMFAATAAIAIGLIIYLPKIIG
jgi:diacylglycerol kinase (ATP)